MPNNKRVVVYYDWSDFGYSVEAIDLEKGVEVDSYHAGNNRNSSADSDSVAPGTANAVARKFLRTNAIKEAKRVCAELGAFGIERDTNLRNAEQED